MSALSDLITENKPGFGSSALQTLIRTGELPRISPIIPTTPVVVSKSTTQPETPWWKKAISYVFGGVPALEINPLSPQTAKNVGEYALEKFPGLTQTLADLQENPLSLGSSLKEIVSTPFTDIKEASNAFNTALGSFIASVKRGDSASKKVAEGISMATALGGGAVTPISTWFNLASKIPIVGNISKLLFNIPFATLGDVSGNIGTSALRSIPDSVISSEAKNNLEPAIRAASTLAGQIVGGKYVAIDVLDALKKQFGEEGAKAIETKAKEMAREKTQRPIIPEVPKPAEVKPQTSSALQALIETTKPTEEMVKVLTERGAAKKVVKPTEIPIKEQLTPEQISERRQIITNNEAKLKEVYATRPGTQEKLNQIYMEMEIAEAGRRTFVRPLGEYTGQGTYFIGEPSTFPQWIPEGLRSRKLFDKVMDGLKDVNNIKYPEGARSTKQRELYDAILQELDQRINIDTKVTRNGIIKVYDELQNKTRPTTQIGGGIAGSQAGNLRATFQEIWGEGKSPEEIALAERIARGVSVPKPPIEPINPRGGYVEVSTLTGGIDKFIAEDLKPATEKTLGGIAKTWDLIKKMVNPSARGEEAKLSASILREALGRTARSKELVYETLSKAKKIFDTYTPEQTLKIIDDIEHGNPTPGFEQFTKIIREALDTRWKKIQDTKGTAAYIENYFPHIWENPEQAKSSFLARFFGKRPFEGTKAYLKQRVLPTIKDGVDLGLKPISYNPVDLVMARIVDMDKFLMADSVWTKFKENGLRQFVKLGGKVPEEWRQVNDKVSRVFQFSPKEKGMILRGNWYMPEQVATILNNYLSPGLAGNPIYNGFRMLSNNLNQVQLGISGFHALFTSGDAVISKSALELQKITSEVGIGKKVIAGGKAVVAPITAPYYLFENLLRGNKLLRDYFRENPQVPELVNALERAGGRVRMDGFYLNNAVTNFLKALRGGNLPGAVVRAPGAIIETLAKPIMQWLVPRQKLGVFADMAKTIMEQAQKERWSEQKSTLRLQEAWDSVDNRMGQLVYDNLFWNKVLKDLGMASTRSLGWNLGTFRELGGGIRGLVAEPIKGVFGKGARLTPKMAYTLALPYVVGTWGAAIYYLYNGRAPQTLLDYYFVPTRKTKPDGTQERIAIPSYMKDVIAYWKEGVAKVITNKIHPEVAALIDMLQNQDYYGTEIRNANDPLVKQFADLVKYQVQQFVPFTVRNLIVRQGAGDTSWGAYLQSFMGITPAPAYITRTPMQAKIFSLYDERFGGGTKTQEQAQVQQLKSRIRNAYWLGNTDEANRLLQQAVNRGVIKSTGANTFIRDADFPADVKLFGQLPAPDQEGLLKGMQLYELQRYAWFAKKEIKNHLSTLSEDAKNFVDMFKRGEISEPTFKRGRIITQ